MTLQIGADVGPYTVLGPARRTPRHAQADGPPRPPRVWLAEPFAGGEPVALITEDPDDPEQPDGAEEPADGPAGDPAARLRREWALSGSLRPPHLAAVHDLIETPEGAVLVTAWAERGSVADLLRRVGRLSAGQTVTVLAGVCAALTACHERGLVHGDVTPDTVLVDGDGRPMLARIGRSTATADQGYAPSAEPRCASPDVARGRAATAVDDVFSLGAVAMQCLTGRPAWPAQDLRDVVVQSEFGQWPRIPENAASDRELGALVDTMLDAEPALRPTVREVLARLADCAPPEPLPDADGKPPPDGPEGGRHAGPAPDQAPPQAPPGQRRQRPDSGPSTPLWSRIVVPALSLVGLVAAAIAVGVWWAGTDRPTAAALPATPASDTTSAAAVAIDWPAVIQGLDARRAAAFAAGDPELLRQVYTVTAPGLVEDATRIRALDQGGLRVDGLRHELAAVELIEPADVTTSTISLRVTDALPAAPLRDAAGSVVGATVPVETATRVLKLEAVAGEYLIASITPAG
jgi:hypothetical protein